ncbi:MAG TPA: dolichyl-phosphate beta-glucosyltransferase [Nitrospiraceae bacterium]|jgi:dolichyl-phosphate beta-glucosyltransferase|nr:dolichyl-phosphate beta-glucosyltransferase [Nitrospiraceae bacterium]
MSVRHLSFLPDLSVVVPAYNEAARILPPLHRLARYLDSHGAPYEILVVDDGSRDGTAAAVERFRAGCPAVRLIRLPANQGKGAAVRKGMLEANGRLQLFTDADGATPIEELWRLEQAVIDGADLAIGSRTLASRDPRYTVRARWHRSVLGALFNMLVRRAGIAGIADTQCGFKLFRRSVARDLFSVASIDGYGFDLELLYVAQRRGYRIAEVPVNWADQPGSKVRVLRDGLRMVRDLFAIRRNDAQGRYAPTESLPHAAEVVLSHPGSPPS